MDTVYSCEDMARHDCVKMLTSIPREFRSLRVKIVDLVGEFLRRSNITSEQLKEVVERVGLEHGNSEVGIALASLVLQVADKLAPKLWSLRTVLRQRFLQAFGVF